MSELIFTVDKISGYIKNIFENESMLQGIQISGEVSGYSETNSNAYFVLKGKESQLNCVYFATDLRKYVPKNGDNCILKGSVTYYKKGGKISVYVTDMRPQGQGDSYLSLLQLKDKLEKEGIFEQKHKKDLPFFVSKLGVVTSKTGAVIHDIIKVATKKYKGIDILLYSVKVQGTQSAKEVAEGIAIMDKANVDVIIVARGGGSAEDLSPYNTETVARAVFGCKTPVISAVGHETDFTLCDLAADLRASTPTLAADIAVQDANSLAAKINDTVININKSVVNRFNNAHNGVKNTLKNMFNNVDSLIERYISDIKFKAFDINFKTEKKYTQSENQIYNLISQLDAKSPVKLLKRGFSMVTDDKGNAINSALMLKQGQTVGITMADGNVEAEIKKIKLKTSI